MKHKKVYVDGRYVPQRMCVACRCVKPKSEMIRISFSDGVVGVDYKGNKPGRGSYICNNVECIEKAQKIRGLERGLKTNVSSEVYEECINIDKQ